MVEVNQFTALTAKGPKRIARPGNLLMANRTSHGQKRTLECGSEAAAVEFQAKGRKIPCRHGSGFHGGSFAAALQGAARTAAA